MEKPRGRETVLQKLQQREPDFPVDYLDHGKAPGEVEHSPLQFVVPPQS